MTDRLLRLVSSDVSSHATGVARVVLGLGGSLEVLSNIASSRLDRVLRPGIIEAPRWDWLPRLSQDGGRVFEVALLLVFVLFTVGWRTRFMGGIACLAASYYLALDQQLYANHVYLLAVLLFLFVLADSGAAVSVDARRGRGRRSVPQWPVFLIKAQLAVVYGFAALSKLNGDWLSGDALAATMVRIGPYDLPAALAHRTVYVPAAIASLLIEGFLAFALLVPRLRRIAAAVGIVFHLSILLTVDRWSPYAITGFTAFSLEIFALYVVALGDDLARGWRPLRFWPDVTTARRPAAS
jgi:Vitamin K-dependent gamma-carboxylase